MIDIQYIYKDLIHRLTELAPFEPDLAIVLGSGLGNFAESLELVKTIRNESLPGFPESTVPGHAGKIHFATHGNKKLLLFQGRIHFYEGYSLSKCILPIHICAELNSHKVLLTNAAGGINPILKPGSLMLNSSFISFNLKKELTDLMGLSSLDLKNSFIDFPSSELNSIIRKAAIIEKIKLHEGVYWFGKVRVMKHHLRLK